MSVRLYFSGRRGGEGGGLLVDVEGTDDYNAAQTAVAAYAQREGWTHLRLHDQRWNTRAEADAVITVGG